MEGPPKAHPEEAWLAQFPLGDGRALYIRHVQPEDEPLIAQAIATSSRQTLLHRFFSPVRRVSPDLLRKMLLIDRKKELCVVGIVHGNGDPRVVCGARYVRLPKPQTAEIAITVHDEFQNRGLGSFLLLLLSRLARADEIRWLEADVMSSNQKMLSLLRKVFPARSTSYQPVDIHHVIIDLQAPENVEAVTDQHQPVK